MSPIAIGSLRSAALVLAATLLVGCGAGAQFVRTDPGFREARRRDPPAVFLDQRPPVPYRSVGTIEVQAEEGTAAANVTAAAVAKGRDVGCDVVVAMSVHEKVSRREGVQLVHEFDNDRSGASAPTPQAPTIKHRFVCGVFAPPAPPAKTEKI